MTALAGADVLVTGGAGTIGSEIVDQLLDAGVAHVDVLDNLVRGRIANLDDALASGRVTLVEGDLRDRDLVHDVTRGKDLVFHEAAIRITQCAEEPRLALEVLVDGSFNVYEAAVEHGVGKRDHRRDAVERAEREVRVDHRPRDDGVERLDMRARGDLRHHAAIGLVLGLREHDVGEDCASPVLVAAHHRGGGLVAGRLDAENEHKIPKTSS